MSNDKQFIDFKKEVEKLKEIDGAEEYAKQLAHLFLGNGLSLQTILLMAIDFGQQHPHWISVEDERPIMQDNEWRSDDVFFVTEDGQRHYGFYREDADVWFSSVIGFRTSEVTHWMSLPQPPRKEE